MSRRPNPAKSQQVPGVPPLFIGDLLLPLATGVAGVTEVTEKAQRDARRACHAKPRRGKQPTGRPPQARVRRWTGRSPGSAHVA
jgi:hypothetical protein